MGYRTVIRSSERAFAIPAEAVWNLLAHTDHLDRCIGLPPVSYGGLSVSAEAVFREARALFFGCLRLAWQEYPFEWVRGERYAVLRLFRGGPLDAFYGGIEIQGDAQRCRVRSFAELTPRTLVGWGLARALLRKGERDLFRHCDRFAALRAAGQDILLPPPPRITPPDRLALDSLLEQARAAGIGARLVARFGRHMTSASDAEVLRMQPYGLADLWGADRAEMLRLLAAAERHGGLVHTWEVMCPNCRVPKVRAAAVEEIPERFHCDACGIEYASDLEQWVELRYSAHPRVRAASDEVYCLGGPANTPHVWAQQYLLPGTERTFSLPLPNEAFRVRVLRANQVCAVDPDGSAGSEVVCTYRPDGWVQIRQRFVPGRVNVRLRNETPQVVVAVLERTGRDPLAITAAQVLRQPLLRELTATERHPASG